MILTVETRTARKKYDATLAMLSSYIERHGKTALLPQRVRQCDTTPRVTRYKCIQNVTQIL